MALDATVGGASANSYLTVAAADAFAGDDLGPEAEKWKDASAADDRRERALQRATREIDDFVRPGFRRHSATQRLRFPRATVDVDSAGDPFIPPEIQYATYCQAIFVLANAAVIDRANARQARNVSQASEPNSSYTQAESPASNMSLRALQPLAAYAKASRSVGASIGSERVASGFAS